MPARVSRLKSEKVKRYLKYAENQKRKSMKRGVWQRRKAGKTGRLVGSYFLLFDPAGMVRRKKRKNFFCSPLFPSLPPFEDDASKTFHRSKTFFSLSLLLFLQMQRREEERKPQLPLPSPLNQPLFLLVVQEASRNPQPPLRRLRLP